MLQYLRDFTLEHPYWTVIFTFIIAIYLFKWLRSEHEARPPGPMGLPFVGYLPFLGSNEYLDFDRLRTTYGPIFSLKLGVHYTLVLSDFKVIKEAFNKDEISDRPPDMFRISRDVQHLGDLGLKDWKDSRRFTLTSLRNLGMGKNKLEQVLRDEVNSVVENLGQMTGKSEFNVHNILYPAINNIIIALICGKKLIDDPGFSAVLDSYSKSLLSYMRITTFICFLPYLKYVMPIFYPGYKKITKDIENMERFLWKEIQCHEETFDEFSVEDYMDYFIAEMRKLKEYKFIFTKGVLNGNSQLLLMAGNDTTMTTIEWALMYLAKHQEVQERVYKEIVETVGKERPPSWDDKEHLPYLDAVLAESSRIKTIVPLADPHWTTSDTNVGGYAVKAGTVIISNIHSVHMDPNLWDKPEEFNPGRFLNRDGSRAKDPEYLIPFSIGKRLCPGERLARVEVFLFVGAILQRFKILPPSGGLNFDSEFALVVHPKNPVIKVQTRE